MKDILVEGREITEKFKQLISEDTLTEAGSFVKSAANAIKSTEEKYYKLQASTKTDSKNLVKRIKSLFKPFEVAATKEYKGWVYMGYPNNRDYKVVAVEAGLLGYGAGDEAAYAIDIVIEDHNGRMDTIQRTSMDEFFEVMTSKFKKP